MLGGTSVHCKHFIFKIANVVTKRTGKMRNNTKPFSYTHGIQDSGGEKSWGACGWKRGMEAAMCGEEGWAMRGSVQKAEVACAIWEEQG